MAYEPAPDRYQSMPYRRCGRSGLLLPPVSMGLWHNFGEVDTYETGRNLVLHAFDRGITHFDLANNYGPPPGSAERHFGKILADDLRPWRDELIISTKAGFRMWPGPYGDFGSRKSMLASLDQSLRRMGLDYVDIFYSHRRDPGTPLEETMGALDHAVRSGRALYAGISSYDASSTREAATILRSLGTPCLIHQPRYNLLDRRIEPELIPALAEEGIGAIAFCPLAQGMLSSRYLKEIPADSRAAKDHGFLKTETVKDQIEIVRSLDALARERGQTLAQMALAWVLRHQSISSALIGASRTEQIDENLKALEAPEWTADELAAVDRACGV